MIRHVRYHMLALLLALPSLSVSQSRTSNLATLTDPRGRPELTICSQNLANYGSINDSRLRDPGLGPEQYRIKEQGLARRMTTAGCDVVAVQELLGKDERLATLALSELAKELRRISGRTFEVRAAPSNDSLARNGFLVAVDRASIVDTLSYVRVELPKLSKDQKPRSFARGPFEIQLLVRPLDGSQPKNVSLVTFHFKSKRGAGDDPAGVEWETWRMEMAEALRRVVETRHSEAFRSGDSPVILLGDRNSNFDTATAKILDGTLQLKDFRGTAPCRLSKRGMPLCQAGAVRPPKFFSVLTTDPHTKGNPGTFVYKKVYSWLDEILLPAKSVSLAWEKYDTEGDYDVGVVSEPRQASDHSLVYVRLNW